MTREEEIKERVEVCGVYYTYDGRKVATIEAEADMRYLLARNEELQREKEKMQAVVDATRKGHPHLLELLDIIMSHYNSSLEPTDTEVEVARMEMEISIALDDLDDKEQDDDASRTA